MYENTALVQLHVCYKNEQYKMPIFTKEKDYEYIDDIITLHPIWYFQKYNSNKSSKQMSQKYVMKI